MGFTALLVQTQEVNKNMSSSLIPLADQLCGQANMYGQVNSPSSATDTVQGEYLVFKDAGLIFDPRHQQLPDPWTST